jgi:ribulose-phosphate 3-epimerase
MAEIIPAIMPATFHDLAQSVALVAHYVKTIQIDIMDGKFVRAKTWPYQNDKGAFEKLMAEEHGLPQWDEVDYEIDLMVDRPEDIIEEWVIAGASRIIVHIESTKAMDDIIGFFEDRFRYIEETQTRDVELILALNVDTPTDTILPYLENIDAVQFMGIDTIGLQGQPFDETVLQKIHEFHNNHPEIEISVDGGVNLDTAPELIEVGVTRLVAGSAIFTSGNIADTISIFKEL